MSLYPEMNAKIVGLLRLSESPHQIYAADLIDQLQSDNETALGAQHMLEVGFEDEKRIAAEIIQDLRAENERLKAENILLADGNLDSPAHMEILRRYYEKSLLAALEEESDPDILREAVLILGAENERLRKDACSVAHNGVVILKENKDLRDALALKTIQGGGI